jgi:hypothetical protein
LYPLKTICPLKIVWNYLYEISYPVIKFFTHKRLYRDITFFIHT